MTKYNTGEVFIKRTNENNMMVILGPGDMTTNNHRTYRVSVTLISMTMTNWRANQQKTSTWKTTLSISEIEHWYTRAPLHVQMALLRMTYTDFINTLRP